MHSAVLVDHMGSDLTVVNSARVSLDKESNWEWWDVDGRGPSESPSLCGEYFNEKRLKEADTRLINYLAKHGHWTPFSHPMITLRETIPIFTARQRFKHMVGFTYNEVSRRYVDDTPEFHYPEVWRSRPEGSIKQGSGTENLVEVQFGQEIINLHEDYEGFIRVCHDQYDFLLKVGVAPEQARMVLPQSMLTSYYVTGSLAAFARAYKQRIDAHSQVEIQSLAKQWGEIIEPLFPVSWNALIQKP